MPQFAALIPGGVRESLHAPETKSQPQKTLWFAFKSDCRLAQLRTGTCLMIHAGGLL